MHGGLLGIWKSRQQRATRASTAEISRANRLEQPRCGWPHDSYGSLGPAAAATRAYSRISHCNDFSFFYFHKMQIDLAAIAKEKRRIRFFAACI
jgi:hypothetical protein